MHHGMLIRVMGDDEGHAREQLEEIVAETIRCHECERSKFGTNWDYFKIHCRVTDKNVQEVGSGEAKTVAEKVQYYIDMRKTEEVRCIDLLKKELKKLINKKGEVKRYSMVGYYLEQLEEIRNCIEYEDADEGMYTLHCTDNHYANLETLTSGSQDFYFWIDRHY